MKSFFKKLAFVMALAMVVSMAAPAAQKAVAAEDKALAIAYQKGAVITALNLAEVGATEDLRFVYAPENWKELDVVWTSSNPNVVSVDQSGVVKAEAAGTATVTVAVGTETASIDVYSVDMKAFDVTIGTAEERVLTEKTVKVGDAVDFKFFGVQDYDVNYYNCVWGYAEVIGEDVVEFDAARGDIVAKNPGKVVVTLTVINKLTLASIKVQNVEVTVEAEVAEVVDIVADLNKTQNTIEVTFDAATELSLADVEMYRVFNADDDNNGDGVIDARDAFEPYQDFYVYAVNANKEKTVYTLVTFDDFADGATYEVRVKGYEPEQFVASVGDVAKVIAYEKYGAYLASAEGDVEATPATLAVKLLDAKGVDVTTRIVNGFKNCDPAYVSYELTTTGAYYLFDDQLMFYADDTAVVKAVYNNFMMAQPIESTPIAVKPSPTAAYGVAKVVAWTVIDTTTNGWSSIDWNGSLQKTVPAKCDDFVIVTLLQDTRGNYFSTHQEGCEKQYVDENGVKHNVLWTEDSNAAFWINGCYAQYKAMSPDKMLVETDGTIKSYEKGSARFALYLYDYNKQSADGLVRELYSQYLTVCHERQLGGFFVEDKDLTVMRNTAKAGTVENAFYSLYSTGFLKLQLTDIHGGDASVGVGDAWYDVTLTNDVTNVVLNNFAQRIENDLNANRAASERTVTFSAADFVGFNGSAVNLKIKETKTGDTKAVTIVLTSSVLDGDSAKVYTVDEFLESLRINNPIDRFVPNTGNFTVEQAITDAKNDGSYWNDGYNFLLNQVDTRNNVIGVDNNIHYALSSNANALFISDVMDVTGATGSALTAGDRVVIITGPDGLFNDNGTFGLRMEVAGTADDETAANQTNYYRYHLTFRDVDANGKVTYAKNGTYNVAIYTVEEVDYEPWLYEADGTTIKTDADGNQIANPNYGKINFAEATGLRRNITITVKNSNDAVTYAGRDKIRLTGDASNVTKQDILDAFNFNLGNSLWEEADYTGDWKLDADDIAYFTTTTAATNNQVVINKVVFKVPVMGVDADGNNTKNNDYRYGYYEFECYVNKAITFE